MKIELPCAYIEVLDSELVHIVYKNEYDVELKDVQEVDATFNKLAKEDKLYVIMDTKGRYNGFSTEAQQYLSKETKLVERGLLGGFAILIDSLAYRMLVKFYMKFYKPNYKLKICSKQEDALKWLLKLKEQDAFIEC